MRAICIAILFLLPYTLYLLFLGKIGWLNITLKSMKHCQLPSEFNCSSNTSLHSYFHFKFVYNIVGLESMIWNTSCSLCSVHRKFPTYKWVVFQKFIFKWDLNLEHIFNVISRYMGYPSKAHFPHQLAVGASTCVHALSLSPFTFCLPDQIHIFQSQLVTSLQVATDLHEICASLFGCVYRWDLHIHRESILPPANTQNCR